MRLRCMLVRVSGSARSSIRIVLPLRTISRRQFNTTPTQYGDVTPLRKELKDATRRARTQPPLQKDNDASLDSRLVGWELTVGIEIHAQLNTARKLFSQARSESEGHPNSFIAPFDIAIPGAQPCFQLSAVVPAIRAAIALNCNIEPLSRFDRKHYFYHDQPQGYQITQYYKPFARNGSVLLTSADGLPESDGEELVIGIKQIQMEQDTAKTAELEDGSSSVDFARSGQPLIEIISLPQIHSPEAASAYLRKIQATLSSIDSVTTGMELGGLRADVNVSVRRFNGPRGEQSYSGVTGLGQRTEIKNLSSFKAVEDAVKAERDRQITILEAGGRIEGETRGWSLTRPNETKRLRGKEGEVDYRYMPDPEIAPLYIGSDLVKHLRDHMPPTPEQLTAMLVDRYGLSVIDAKALIALDNGLRLVYYQQVVDFIPIHSDVNQLKIRKAAGNWVLHELGALLSTTETAWTPELVQAQSLARIIELHDNARITGPSAKRLLRIIFKGDKTSVDSVAEREGLWFMAMEDDELRVLATKIIDEHAKTSEAIRQGNNKKLAFLVGQIMRTVDRNRIDVRKAEAMFRSLLLG